MLLTATLKCGDEELLVKLRDLSAKGALVEADNLPALGSNVIFQRKNLIEWARVVWVDGNHAGITFKHELQPEQVLESVPKPRPKAVPEFRRPRLACQELSPEERKLIDKWL